MKQKYTIIALFFTILVFLKPVIARNNNELIITKKNVMVYEDFNSDLSRKYRIGIIKFLDKSVLQKISSKWTRIKTKYISGWIDKKYSSFIPESWIKYKIDEKYYLHLPKHIKLNKIKVKDNKYKFFTDNKWIWIHFSESQKPMASRIKMIEHIKKCCLTVNSFLNTYQFNFRNKKMYFWHSNDLTGDSAITIALIIELAPDKIISMSIIYYNEKLSDYYDLMKILFSITQSVQS